MKYTILLLCTLFSSTLLAQEENSFVLNEDMEVVVNGTIVNEETTISTLTSLLGTPELVKEYPNGKKNYIYPNLGIGLSTYNDILLMIGVNFNWDGDKKFPEATYTGTCSLGSVTFNKTSSEEALDEFNLFNFKPMFAGLFMAKTENFIALVGFKDEVVTQIGFEFNPE